MKWEPADFLTLGGLTLLSTGLAMWSIPLACITLGCIITFAGLHMARTGRLKGPPS